MLVKDNGALEHACHRSHLPQVPLADVLVEPLRSFEHIQHVGYMTYIPHTNICNKNFPTMKQIKLCP